MKITIKPSGTVNIKHIFLPFFFFYYNKFKEPA